MTDAFIALDRDWRIIYMNGAAQRLGQQPSRTAIGRSHWEEWPITVGSEVERQYRRAMATQQPVHFEHHYLSADRDFWHEIHAYPGENGLSVFFRDVTEQRRSRDLFALLARAGAQFASTRDLPATLRLVAQMALPLLGDWSLVYLVDDAGRVTNVDVAAMSAGAYSLSILGSISRQISAAAVDERLPLIRAMRSGDPAVVRTDTEFYAGLADTLLLPELLRQLAPLSMLSVPLVARGHTIGVLTFGASAAGGELRHGEHGIHAAREVAVPAALALDNARLYESERQARRDADDARERAERANRSKADFLGAVSHELRTPLNAIAGYIDLLNMGVHGTLTADQKRDLERVSRNHRHVTTLLNDLLCMAQLGAGRIEFDCKRLVVGTLLRELGDLIPPEYTDRRHDLRIRPCPGENFAVWADADRTMQVLLNLTTNALKFTPVGGTIEVYCDETQALLNAGTVWIKVRDSGAGISLEEQRAIFEPFVHGRGSGGIGLGLPISRDLARGMGGDVTVVSQPGRGATFTLALPAADSS